MLIIAIVVTMILSVLFAVHTAEAGDLPNPILTPGVARDVTVHELCTTSTTMVRNVPDSEKKAVYKSYGMAGDDRSACGAGYEIDHLISLEIGGANDIKNLWPQSYCGPHSAHIKDACENKLHALVCAGKMQLEDAQRGISGDWINFCGGLK